MHSLRTDEQRRSLRQASLALADLIEGVRRARVVNALALQDVKNRYRRSSLGVFWIVISMAVTIAIIGFVFGALFAGVEIDKFIPYIAISLILWSYISGVIGEGCTAFISNEEYILADRMPLSLFVYRTMWHGTIIFAHNLVIFVAAALYFRIAFSFGAFVLVLPGLALLMANCFWLAVVLALVCCRFRDIPQIVANVLQIVFYLTPIIWTVDLLPRTHGWLVQANPLFHLIEVVRSPLLGERPAPASWAVAVATLLLGSTLAFILFSRYRRRVPYWL